jgi:hypothetical protein
VVGISGVEVGHLARSSTESRLSCILVPQTSVRIVIALVVESLVPMVKPCRLVAETLLALLGGDIALLNFADFRCRRALVQVVHELAQ